MKHQATFSRGCKRNFLLPKRMCCRSYSDFANNLTFPVLGLFFLDNFIARTWLESVQRTTQGSQVVRLLWISLPCIASERRGSSHRNKKLVKISLHCKKVVSFVCTERTQS